MSRAKEHHVGSKTTPLDRPGRPKFTGRLATRLPVAALDRSDANPGIDELRNSALRLQSALLRSVAKREEVSEKSPWPA
jgi:hypothetical protein